MGCGASYAAPELSKEPVTVDLGTLQADDAIDPGDDIGKAAAITFSFSPPAGAARKVNLFSH